MITDDSGNNNNSKYVFIASLLNSTECVPDTSKFYTHINAQQSQTKCANMLTFQTRQLRLKRVKELPKVKQSVSSGTRISLQAILAPESVMAPELGFLICKTRLWLKLQLTLEQLGLNCAGPLIQGFFSINTVHVFSLPFDFLNKFSFL